MIISRGQDLWLFKCLPKTASTRLVWKSVTVVEHTVRSADIGFLEVGSGTQGSKDTRTLWIVAIGAMKGRTRKTVVLTKTDQTKLDGLMHESSTGQYPAMSSLGTLARIKSEGTDHSVARTKPCVA